MNQRPVRCCVVLALICAVLVGGNAARAAGRPNIVFLLADDLGWRDVGCFGSPFCETPNIDRLAAQGARFTQAYTAGSVCLPTRSSIMTGKHPVRTGVTDYIPGLSRAAHADPGVPQSLEAFSGESGTAAPWRRSDPGA